MATIYEERAKIFKALCDEKRQRIIELLQNGEQCACVLLEQLNMPQSTLSYHMKILCQSGIVKERPVGPWKYYSIDGEGCAYAQKLLQALSSGGETVGIRLIRALSHLSACASRTESTEPLNGAFDLSSCCNCCHS